MRITQRIVAGAALVLTASLAVTGCTKYSDSASGGGDGGGTKYRVAFVPKLQGIPYFEAMNAGGEQAAKDNPNLQWLYQGPTTADAAAQADVVRSFMQQKVNALFVAPNDPDSMGPLLAQASGQGVKVGTADTDAPNSVRQVFVEQATSKDVGQAVIDQLLQPMGGKGSFAIVSCGETAANLNSWIQVEKDYVAQKYPDAKLLDVVYAGEDQNKATQMATDLINAHPDLTGLIGQCSSSAPAVAQAVQDAGRIGKVFSVGVGTPKAMAPYLKNGSSSASVLWDVQQLGYLTAWTGAQLAEGKELAAINHVSDALPAVPYDAASKTLVLGPPLVLTTDNVDKYNY
ncbi:autoinducer 2 ABC transporter substrate-binding protein [Amycolatopsis taiwanensis]|uniref:Sugar ABC transporter substrate-binding protein n=1 Tax=Amycolatopsis taiwanensis TaxID=342230 RepID=A0A9W6R255_9PSEU|nr:autoinducer 2 ABC transporter substrate-binding protein [Amycolatopsis taiwanensis]GLY68141.1 sugar ABC transporter substrate-binding protein [Amycolatopsis taiwanensis]